MLLFELEIDVAFVFLSGSQHCRGESLYVGSVGEILTLYCHTVIVVVAAACLVDRAAGKPATCIYLHAGHVCADFEHASRFAVGKHCHYLSTAWLELVDYPAVVVAFAKFKGGEGQLDIAADLFAAVKSIGVPSTSTATPSGIRVESVGR